MIDEIVCALENPARQFGLMDGERIRSFRTARS
jgi:hypothetical protein